MSMSLQNDHFTKKRFADQEKVGRAGPPTEAVTDPAWCAWRALRKAALRSDYKWLLMAVDSTGRRNGYLFFSQ